MGTLLCKSSVGLKLQGRVRDALISRSVPWRAAAPRPTGSSTTIAKNSAADQHYRSNDYAFGLKKPRRTQMTQRPNSSSTRGIVPACPARCLRWSPNVQMPAPSGTRIGAVSSAVRGVEVLLRSLLTASLRPTSLPSLRNIRTEFVYINDTRCGHARAVWLEAFLARRCQALARCCASLALV
jgi:hypothetical protein